jgi:glyoxylase-like metal-dependent hydrolase (beta-lactamase superfamily II)
VLRVVRVLAPNPGPFTLEGTNTWIVGSEPALVIDPGPDDRAHLEAVAQEAGTVRAILLTHDHPDHAAGAEQVSGMVGAPVRAFRAGPGREQLADGERIPADGAALRTVPAPGHTADHVVFLTEGEGGLFTGDAVLGRGTSVIDPPEGDLASYLRSLEEMLSIGARVIYPGHGPTVFDAEARLREYLAHRARREEQVLRALERGPAMPDQLVPGIYADVQPELHPVAARQVLAHLLKLEKEGRVVRTGIGRRERFTLAGDRVCERCGRAVAPGQRLCRRCSLDALQETPSEPDAAT